MYDMSSQIQKNIKHLMLLAKQYPTIQGVCTEIINLRAILNLPKATEHFMSDLHGEYEAFTHILNNCSGVVKEKMDILFADTVPEKERAELCTLIYYPHEKLEQIKSAVPDPDAWYEQTLLRLIDVCALIAGKYTRSKVRKALPKEYSYIIDELLHADFKRSAQSAYYNKILESIIALHNADAFIIALSVLIKRLAVDRLHIVGDIFDRGPRPDLIMDLLENHHSIDIQWGNHDILWMGAACGNPACAASVVANSAAFGNLMVLEQGYGINLRPLALFAEKTYAESPVFRTRGESKGRDAVLAGKMYKAISIILFKLEGQLVKRHPDYGMESRLLLDKIDLRTGMIELGGTSHKLLDADLPTLQAHDAFALTDEEARIITALTASFQNSERLERHVRFLYSHGGMYRIYNQNLMFHGCVPMDEDGGFTSVTLCGQKASGKALLDIADKMARRAYFGTGDEKRAAVDGMWFLWCGRNSPLFGRDRMTTFERLFIKDETLWTENKNAYYRHILSLDGCVKILGEFGLTSEYSHIINGHVPVRAAEGESPIKGGGRLIVIDGGFCKAYHPKTGIAGYTLIYNSWGLRLSAHMPFESAKQAVEQNIDIHSTTNVFETMDRRIQVMDTDIGESISEQIYDLSLLLEAYRYGILFENGDK